MKGQSTPETASISQQVLVGIKMIPRMLGRTPSARPSTRDISNPVLPKQGTSPLTATQIPTPTLTPAPLPGPVSPSRLSYIPSISPSVGMRGVLYHKDLQLTIVYLEKIPYTGDPVTQPVGIVEPWPKLVVGARLFVFINGEHFEVEITAIAPRRTKSTLSEVISATLEDDKIRINHFQEHFLATGPSASAVCTLEPLPEEELPGSPTKSLHAPQRPGLPNVSRSDSGQVTQGPSLASTTQPLRSARTRTASDAAVQPSQEKCQVQQTASSQSPRPSDSTSPIMAVPSTRTPVPRYRALSDAVVLPHAKWPNIMEVPRHIKTVPIAHTIPSTSTPEDTVPRSGLLLSAKALWENNILFPKRNKETGSSGSIPDKFISVEESRLVTVTDLLIPRSPLTAERKRTRSSWVTQPEWATARSDEPEEEDCLVDQLATIGSAEEHMAMQPREASRTNSTSIDKAKQRERPHPRGSVVRVPLDTSAGSSPTPTGKRLSSAESRKSSSGKDLPPVPAIIPIQLPSDSIREESSERPQAQEKHMSTAGSLGAALELTPPATPLNAVTSDRVEPISKQDPPEFKKAQCHRYNNDVPMPHKNLGSSSRTMATTRFSSSMIKHAPRDRDRAMKTATLAPSDDMLALVSRGSFGSVRTPINRNSGAIIGDASPAPSWAEMYKKVDKTLLAADYTEGVPRPIDMLTSRQEEQGGRKTQSADRGSGVWLASRNNDEQKRSGTRVRPPTEKF